MDTIPTNVEPLIERAATAVFSSIDSDGFPNTRALLPPRAREGLKHFYFTTNTSSCKAAHLAVNPKACLYFYDASRFIGVMLIGTAAIVRDEASLALVWRKGDEQYYPQGIDDPDYAVLKFTAHTLRYYSDFNPRDYRL
ncbi:MAG: pyridoxamine 5'-phosphate oxidase family protein [Burkholderiales bacterium]|jgi:general stress protein 26|nr:pyridoxamine 5'-phosphate oxidase family protein [Burkholderiales bacterium]